MLALELPTGGLSDALGRRPVLVIASVVAIVSMSAVRVADSVALFFAAMVLQGVYRALDSGPLEAWFVDATLAADPNAEIEHGLGRRRPCVERRDRGRRARLRRPRRAAPDRGVDPLLLPLLVALAAPRRAAWSPIAAA